MIAAVEGPGREPFAATFRADAPEPVPAGPGPKKQGGGPQTAAGKERSRMNSTKDGLRAFHVFPEELQVLIERRTEEFTQQFQPWTDYETSLVRDMAVGKAKVDRCLQLQTIDDDQTIFRADLCWDQDMEGHVESLAARLRRDPSRVSKALAGSLQGNRWLTDRWRGLGYCVKENGCWTEDQRQLAFDLIGVPPELRNNDYWVPAATDAPRLARLVVAHIKRLRAGRESLAVIDDAARGMALVGVPCFEFPTTARLRKAVTAARRDWHWAHRELLRVRNESESESASESESEQDRKPSPSAEATASPSRSSSSSTSRTRSKPAPEPTAMPILSNAAMTYLEERTIGCLAPDLEREAAVNAGPGVSAADVPDRAPAATAVVAPSAPDHAPAAAVPPPPAPPTPAREYRPMAKSLVPGTEPRNRRERRALEARARKNGA